MKEFMGTALPIDMDTVIAGAILADVGKLLEYEKGEAARRVKASAASSCVTLSPELLLRWNAVCRTPSATSLRLTLAKAIW